MPYRLLSQSCFYCPNLITVAPLELEIKRFVMWLWADDITTAWGVPNGTLSMRFTCCPSLMFLAFPWLEIWRFQIGHFADCEGFKADIHFANFGQVKTVPICSFLLTVDRSQLLYSVWVRHTAKNNPNLHLIKIQEPRTGFGRSYFQWFNQQESRTGFLSQ